MRKNHRKALNLMCLIDKGDGWMLSDKIVKKVDAAEKLLSKLGKRREFQFEWFAILLADIPLEEWKVKVPEQAPVEPEVAPPPELPEQKVATPYVAPSDDMVPEELQLPPDPVPEPEPEPAALTFTRDLPEGS